MFNDDSKAKVDFENPIEGTPEGAENFSIEEQRDRFLGGSSGGNSQNEKTPLRFRKVLEVSRFDIKKPTIEGIENLPKVPCVVATTHLSDIDVSEVVMAIAGQRKVGIVSQETNLRYPPFKPFIAAMGKENLFSIENDFENNNATYRLRIDDFKKMQEGINQQRRTMVIAAHKPTRDWRLPEKGGMGAVILAHMANVPLVPAAVDIKSATPVAQSTDIKTRLKNFVTMNRPEAKIIFGEPIQISEIPEEKLRAAVSLYSLDQRRKMSEGEVASAKQTLGILQEEADRMMLSIASKLPPEKRGKWGQLLNSNGSIL